MEVSAAANPINAGQAVPQEINTKSMVSANKQALVKGIDPGEVKAASYPDEDSLKNIIDEIKKTLKVLDAEIKIKYHQETNTTIVQLIDTRTKQVIREIPSEKVINLVLKLEELLGILVDEKI